MKANPHYKPTISPFWVIIFILMALFGIFLIGVILLSWLGWSPSTFVLQSTLSNPQQAITRQAFTTSIYITDTPTPFQPLTDTPIPPTPTLTNTPTPTHTPTETSTPTSTQPIPTDTPKPETSTYIRGVVGYDQSLPLSCESRSAVDWAAFLGKQIFELEFQSGLPSSGNPNKGFVGNPADPRGQLPPNSYGVYAKPIAALLKEYGIKAAAKYGATWKEVQAEISSGQPVIAWVVGNVEYGYATTYTTPDGEQIPVVPFEHTVIIIGYSSDTVTVVDGSMEYTVDLQRFLKSWAVLGNQIVYYKP